MGSHTVESLAAQVDKSVKYVYRSLRLLELPVKAVMALEEGIITTGHAQQILRASEKNVEALVTYATTRLEWQKRVPTVDELREYVEKRIAKNLVAAPFPKEVPYAEQMACSVCPFKVSYPYCTSLSMLQEDSGNRRRSFRGLPGWAVGKGPSIGAKRYLPASSAFTARSTPSLANLWAV